MNCIDLSSDNCFRLSLCFQRSHPSHRLKTAVEHVRVEMGGRASRFRDREGELDDTCCFLVVLARAPAINISYGLYRTFERALQIPFFRYQLKWFHLPSDNYFAQQLVHLGHTPELRSQDSLARTWAGSASFYHSFGRILAGCAMIFRFVGEDWWYID